jgi:AAA domain
VGNDRAGRFQRPVFRCEDASNARIPDFFIPSNGNVPPRAKGGIEMTHTPRDLWNLRRFSSINEPINGELSTMSEALRPIAEKLAETPFKQRRHVLDGFVAGQPDRNDLSKALAEIDPAGPPPLIHPPRRFATCADVVRLETATPWAWKGFLPSSRIVGIASGEGVGKTRFALDLSRRAWHEEDWPDGQPMTLPRKSPTIWVPADGQHTELAQSLSLMRMPPEAIIFPAPPDEPFGGVSLDDPETFEALDEAARIHRPAFIIIDSLTYATRLDIGEQTAIALLKGPLVKLAQTREVIVMLLLHLSREGQALGRRIRGITRTLMHLECPDANESERLRLWVEKSYAMKPPAMGVTIGETGNTYDFNPPAPKEGGKPGRPSKEKAVAVKFIRDELKAKGRAIGNELCAKYEDKKKGSQATFWRAVKELKDAGELTTDGGPGTRQQMALELVPTSQN